MFAWPIKPAREALALMRAAHDSRRCSSRARIPRAFR
jgi:hypothetical protein